MDGGSSVSEKIPPFSLCFLTFPLFVWGGSYYVSPLSFWIESRRNVLYVLIEVVILLFLFQWYFFGSCFNTILCKNLLSIFAFLRTTTLSWAYLIVGEYLCPASSQYIFVLLLSGNHWWVTLQLTGSTDDRLIFVDFKQVLTALCRQ